LRDLSDKDKLAVIKINFVIIYVLFLTNFIFITNIFHNSDKIKQMSQELYLRDKNTFVIKNVT